MALTGPALVLDASSHTSLKFRQFMKSLLAMPGVAGAGDCLVKQRVSTGQGLLVSAGGLWMPGTTSSIQGDYYDFNDADYDVAATAASGTQTRIDRVIYRVRDPVYVAGTPTGIFEWLTGTAGSGTPPTVPADSISLAQVARAISGNNLTNAMITDERVFASAQGGAVRGWAQTGPPTTGTYVAKQYGFDAVGALWVCTVAGTPGTWVAPGGGAWTSYTPTWTSSGTAPVIGNGTLAARYRVSGKTMYWRLTMVMGSTTTFGGAGLWSWSLPGGFTAQGAGAQAGVATASSIASTTFANVFVDSSVAQVRSFLNSTTPYTWANTYTLSASLTFELA
jgi:hypothetical protein